LMLLAVIARPDAGQLAGALGGGTVHARHHACGLVERLDHPFLRFQMRKAIAASSPAAPAAGSWAWRLRAPSAPFAAARRPGTGAPCPAVMAFCRASALVAVSAPRALPARATACWPAWTACLRAWTATLRACQVTCLASSEALAWARPFTSAL